MEENGEAQSRKRFQEEVSFESRAERRGRSRVADRGGEVIPDAGSLIGEGALAKRLCSNGRDSEYS